MVRRILDKIFRKSRQVEVFHRATVRPDEYRFAENATTATELTVKKINEHFHSQGLGSRLICYKNYKN